ncbi:MAG: DUF177 domain-containing protein [Candidatus Ancillula sp.]|jgi:uncharacterized protein|nr:DUF177 domain-containing protein [Candidatus Ancillula sp.]
MANTSSFNIANLLKNLNETNEIHSTFRLEDALDLSVVGVAESTEVDLSGTLTSITGGIALSGNVSTRLWQICSSCGKKTEVPFKSQVSEFFSTGVDDDEDFEEDYRIEGDEIDFAPVVRDYIAASVEFSPRCPECAVSGFNTQTFRDPDDDGIDPRLAKLKDFLK